MIEVYLNKFHFLIAINAFLIPSIYHFPKYAGYPFRIVGIWVPVVLPGNIAFLLILSTLIGPTNVASACLRPVPKHEAPL